MRETSAVYRQSLATTHGVSSVVSSWRSGTLLAAKVPIADGKITYDDTATLRRRLTLTVPVFDPVSGFSWDPGDNANHPLAAYGQRLNVRLGIILPTGVPELFNHGWYLITGWTLSEDERTVAVTAVDLAQLLVDFRLYRTSGPGKGRRFSSAFSVLTANLFNTVIDPAIPDSFVQPATVWERDRVKDLNDLCDAFGARWFIADDASAHAAPAYPQITSSTTPDLVLVSGANGTVVDRQRDADRARLYNAVVVNGKTPSETGAVQPYGYAEITDARSPIRVSGPYGRKPRFYTSELLTTSAQCAATARTLLPGVSSVSRSEPIIAVPDPAMELGDVVQVRTQGTRFTGRVTSIALPMTAEDGAMTVTISNEPNMDDEGES